MINDRADTSMFLEFCGGLLDRGIGFRFQACGTSMAPTIRHGEIVNIEPAKVEQLRKGDVVLFTDGTTLSLHRLVAVDHENDMYITRGDARLENDPAMRAAQILGRAVTKEKIAGAAVKYVPLRGLRAGGHRLLAYSGRRLTGAARRVASAAAMATLSTVVCAVLALASLIASPAAFAQGCAVPGNAGDGGTLTGVINTYYPGTANANAGATSISVGTPTGSAARIAAGDLLLVIQMQDATIAQNNNATYGGSGSGSGWSALNSTGKYEFVRATGPVSGGAVPIYSGTTTNVGLLNAYHYTAGSKTFQVIRVPQYSKAKLGALTAAPWSGTNTTGMTGGILVLDVAGNLDLNGATVSVDGLGFRGGAGLQLSGGAGANIDYLQTAPATYTGVATAGQDGSKGEGIAGTPRWVQFNGTYLNTGNDGYTSGSMARGAPGNAGGGGTNGHPSANDDNSGGGGGSNGGAGGMGGEAWAYPTSPNITGGLGGSAFTPAVNMVIMGGGGGAGDRNNSDGDNQAGSGAAGGGIVIIRSSSLSGTGTITANGAAAYNLTSNDGSGGGGGGGSVIVATVNGSTTGLSVQAHGGRGGDNWETQAYSDAQRHGPGGGGGGGVVFTSGTPTGVDVSGGATGLTLNPGVAYGAIAGSPGVTGTASLSAFSGIDSGAECAPDVTITSSHTDNQIRGNLTPFTYSLVVSNGSSLTATSGLVTVNEVLPFGLILQGASGTGWTCSTASQTATCTRSDALAASTSYPAITITAKVAQTAPDATVTTATVSGGGEFNLANDTATDPTNVISVADLSVTTTPAFTVSAGGSITYAHTVTNNGFSDATNAVFIQTIPANTTFSSISAPAGWICSTPGVGGAGVVSCTALNFAANSSANISVVVAVPSGTASGTVIQETASVASLIVDNAVANNTASVSTTVGTTAQADLAVSDSATPNPVLAGSNIVYTQTVRNNGAVAATTATFDETVVANTGFQSLTIPTGAGWTCPTLPAVGATGSIHCTSSSVPAGWTGNFVLTVKVGAVASGTSITNTVTLGAANDAIGGNNTATTTVIAATTGQADIGIATVGAPSPVIAGNNLSYTHVISNNGPATAGTITFTQVTPANTTFQSVTVPDGVSCTTPAVNGTGTITCTVAAGAVAGQSATVVVTVNVNPGATGSISATATVAETGDPIAANNTTTTTTPVIALVDLTLGTTMSPGAVARSANITYTHTITNAGPSTATTVAFTEAVPAYTTFYSITPPAGWSCTTPAVGATGTISCTVASLAPNATATLTIVVRVNSGSGTVPNGTIITGSASVSSATYETNTANNATSVTTVVSGGTQSDLSVTNVSAPASVMAGSNITYTQVVTNNGRATASTLTFTDVLPANTTFVSLAPQAGWTCSTPAVGSAGTVTCTINTLALNATATFSLVVKVDPSTASGTITDSVSVSSTTADPNTNNNSASTSTSVATQADLAATTNGPNTITAGSNITYTQTVVNNGPGSAATVSWTEAIPNNTTFVSFAVPTGWNCGTLPAVGATGTITCTIASLAPTGGTPVSFPLVVKVNSGVASGTAINNSATVSSATTDPALADNTASDTVIVATAAQADISVTTVGAPGSVQSGANLTYTQQVTNNGPASAAAPTFTQSVPTNATFVSMTPPAGWTCGTLPAVGATGTVTCTATSSLASGASATFTLIVQVSAQTPPGTTITNTATATSTTGDPTATNNTGNANNPVTDDSVADVAVTMSGPDTVLQGNNATYTATVTNNGPSTATNVLLTDALTADLAFVSASSTVGTCSQAGGTVSCALGSMNSGASATITIIATALNPDLISNTASVAADQSDPTMANNTATVNSVIVYPTQVKLKSFTATNSGGTMILQWATGGESHNLGFNVYRDQNGKRVRINPSLIAGSALRLRRGSQGQAAKTYAFVDPVPGSGQYGYWLEDVDLNGVRTMHGPAYAFASARTSSHAKALTAAISSTVTFADISQAQVASPPPPSYGANARTVPGPVTTTQQQIQFALAALPAVKIQVEHEGWYSVPLAQLNAAGMTVRDASSLHLFAEGIEQPILLTGNKVNGQAIEFYGTGIDTQYSDTRAYWLIQGDSTGTRVPQQMAAGQNGFQAQSFPQTVELRDRTTFFAALTTPDGNNFFGDLVSSTPVDQVLNATNIAGPGSEPVTVQVVLQGVVAGAQHDIEVSFNGMVIGQVSFQGQASNTFMVEVPSDSLHEGANTVTLQALDGDNDISLVDHIVLTYPRAFVASGDSLRFTANAGDNVTVAGFRAPARVIDISNSAAPVELLPAMTSNAGYYSLQVQVPWTASGTHTLLAFAPDAISVPAGVVSHQPSQWHAAQLGTDTVMITYPDFAQELAPLANLRRTGGHLVSVITVDQIYDEFNFGEKSPQAIRDFLKTASTAWTHKPQYLLLAGNASVDPRNYLGMGSLDFVPTKIVPTSSLMTASDDWFSDFADTGLPQISTGRLPVTTVAQTHALVAKIIGHESSSNNGPWQQQVLMVADSDDNQSFTGDTLSVQSLLPSSYQVTDVLAAQMDTATARNNIVSAINGGKLLVNYIGHGSVDTWSDQDLLDADAVGSLQNGTRLPVFFAVNCLNGYFYDVYQESMAEALLLAPNGGAVAVVASSGLTDPQPQVDMDQNLVKQLADNPTLALGDAVRLAKSGVTDPDVRRTYMLFGDPTMRLSPQSVSPATSPNPGQDFGAPDLRIPTPRIPVRGVAAQTMRRFDQ